jgi:hypothetical protein
VAYDDAWSRAGHSLAEALAVAVPNVGALPWEALLEFRQHRASQEARAKLREFEARVADGESERGHEYLRKVHAEVTTAPFQALEEPRRSLPAQPAGAALKTGVSLGPGCRRRR